jgi:restriction system protein
MTIWEYAERRETPFTQDFVYNPLCMYCHSPLERDREDESNSTLDDYINYGMSDGFTTATHAIIGICPGCGWWKYAVDTQIGGRPNPSYENVRIGSLMRLDLSSGLLAIADVRDYLVAKYESRFQINPRIMEELVASIYRDHGFESLVTAYSGDGGIDVILRGPHEQTVGVQVKRYRGRISVSQIRELVGALVVNGHTRGVFVTTSEFQSGAHTLAQNAASKGVFIELVDGLQLFEKLRIAQLSSTRIIADRKPWGEVPTSSWLGKGAP